MPVDRALMPGSFHLRGSFDWGKIKIGVRGLLLGGLLGLGTACQAPGTEISAPPARLAPVAAIETTILPQAAEDQMDGENRQADVPLEFEGRYQVGDTFCTITPVRMAFELRWARGKGVMRFFYNGTSAEGKPEFVSEDRHRGRDRFIFDDDGYSSGRFIRADGVTMKVRRSPK